MTRRIFTCAIALCMMFTLFTSVAMASSEETVTIRFAWWGGDARTEATLEVINQFQELNPNIIIEPEYGSSDGYHDRLATQLASGTAADIVQIDPETMPTYVATGDYFIDFAANGFDLSKFDPNYIGKQINGNYDGRQLGLPTGIAGPTLLVNQDLADQFGIDFTADFDWDQLIAWGKQVHESDPEVYLLCVNNDYITNLIFLTYLAQLTGTTVFDPDTKTMNSTQEDLQKALELVKALYDNNVIPPAAYSTVYSGDNLQTDPNWISGKYVANFSYISTLNVMTAGNPAANYSISKLPIIKGATEAGFACNCPQVLAITSTSKHPEEAMMFLDYFFNNTTAMATLACVRSIPPTSEARDVCATNGTLDPLMVDAANIVGALNGTPSDKYSSSQEAKQIVADTIEIVGYGQMEPAAAAADLYEQLQSFIEVQ
jgi:oligogalacturonide transport system substrate-binding protein